MENKSSNAAPAAKLRGPRCMGAQCVSLVMTANNTRMPAKIIETMPNKVETQPTCVIGAP